MYLLKLISDAIYDNDYPQDILGIICEYVPHKRRVFCGYNNSTILKNDGTLYSWGENKHDQVSDTPKGSGFMKVSVGRWHCVALKDDGTLHSWGDNRYGQISDIPK